MRQEAVNAFLNATGDGPRASLLLQEVVQSSLVDANMSMQEQTMLMLICTVSHLLPCHQAEKAWLTHANIGIKGCVGTHQDLLHLALESMK